MQVNEITFAGYAGRDAEEKQGASGKAPFVTVNICNTKKGKDGREDESTWVQLIASGYTADIARGIKKGDNVIAVGQLRVKNYKTKDGADRTSVSILVQTIGVIHRPPSVDNNSFASFDPTLDDVPF